MPTRRTFIKSTLSAPVIAAAGKSIPAAEKSTEEGFIPNRWPSTVYRRFSVDIHVPDWDKALLSNFDPQKFVGCLSLAKLQSHLQYTNSHVGLCLWKTDIGKRHANMGDRDFFGEIVSECRKKDIHPLAYFSLIFDNWSFESNPDWRITYADGSFQGGRYGTVCPNSPYRDYVFSCVNEIASRYDIDGMFFDMTFWPGVCYCLHCKDRFMKETGKDAPTIVDWKNPVWREFQKARQNWLLEFAMKCTETAKKAHPGITVNHQYSTIFHPFVQGVPLELTNACDYVGGDFYGGPAQHSLACKILNSLTRSKPFEFHTSRTRVFTDHVTVKPMEEIKTESYVATLHHSALMIVDYINVDGTLNREAYEFLGKLNNDRAVYEKELGGKMLADVGIFFDKNSFYNPDENGVEITKIQSAHKSPHTEAVVGMARILQEHHISYGVVTNINIEKIDNYQAIIIPSVLEMTAEQADKFREYVRNGGAIYATGLSSLDRISEKPEFFLGDVLGIKYDGMLGTTMTYLTPKDPTLKKAVWPQDHVSYEGAMIKAVPNAESEILSLVTLPFVDPALGKNIGSHFAAIHSNPPALEPGNNPSAVLNSFGKGISLWTSAPFEIRNEKVNKSLVLNFLKRILRKPLLIETEAHPSIETTLFDQPGKKRIVAGVLNMQQQLPQIPEGAKIRVRIPEGKKIFNVRKLPENSKISFRQSNGYIEFEIQPFDIFTMIGLDYL